jgi:fumarate hydratase subunit alpha
MRTIQRNEIYDAIKDACISIQNRYSPAMEAALNKAIDTESGTAKSILEVLMENSELASTTGLPMCQDTGIVVVWVQLGHQVILESPLEETINESVKDAYEIAYLRKSVVKDPLFNRINTKDNTPAVVHVDLIEGDQCILHVAAKGFGSENMSALIMLTPADGVEGAKKFILDTVSKAGPNACPPMVIGVGVGGTMDQAAWLAKRSLFREIGERNTNTDYATLEEDLLQQINELGIGPQGLGGKTTALEVFIEYYPTHIAGLPVAVNIQCHMTRHHKVVL